MCTQVLLRPDSAWMVESVRSRLRRYCWRLKGSGYATDIRKVATSAVISQALLLACTPILTRLYTPTDFGILAVFVSVLGVIPVIACFRYDIAISLSEDRQESFHTLTLCLFGALCCTGMIGVLFASGVVNEVDSSLAQIQRYGWLVTLGTLAVGVFTALNAWVGYAQKFSLVAKVKVKQALSSVIAQVGLGLLCAGPIGLLIGYVISQSYGATSFALEVRRARPRRFRVRDVWEAASKYRHFFFFAFPAGVVNRLGIHIIPVLIGIFYSIPIAGFYLLAQRLVALPTLVIGRSVAQVYTNKLARDSRTGTVRLLPVYLRTVLALLALGVMPMGALAASAPWLFQLIFGDQWRLAGVFCQILIPAFYAQFVISPMIQTLNVLGHQKAQLGWDLCRLVGIVAVFFVADFYGLTYHAGVASISATLFITYGFQFLLSVWAIRRHDNLIEV